MNETKIYKKYGLTKAEYFDYREGMGGASYHLHATFFNVGDNQEPSILYLDGDGGGAILTGDSEIFETEGFSIKLLDCNWCDMSFTLMKDIADTIQSYV